MLDLNIDSCAWNHLADFGIDLRAEFPPDSFRLWIPREIEMELAAIPQEKQELHAFIRDAVSRCEVKVDVWFGFCDQETEPAARKVGGFDESRWISQREWEFFDSNRHLIGSGHRPTHLKKNEGDLALAARSFTSVVLTADVKSGGPLEVARLQGGNVLDIRAFKGFSSTFRDFVVSAAPSSEFLEQDTGG